MSHQKMLQSPAMAPKVGDCSTSTIPSPAPDETNSAACSSSTPLKNRKASPRRKSRAVVKAPIRQLSARDRAQFKRIVHRFTGSPMFSSSQPPPSPLPAPPSSSPTPPPPPLTSLHTPPPADFPPIPTSAIARSLRSTLHVITTCLKLLHDNSSSPAASGIQNEELSMCKRRRLAFLQGLIQSQKERDDPKPASVDLATPARCVGRFGSIASELDSNGGGGDAENGSVFDDFEWSNLFLNVNGSDDDAHISLDGGCGGDSKPLLDYNGLNTHDIDFPNNTSCHSPSTSSSSDNYDANDAKPLLLEAALSPSSKLRRENPSNSNSYGVNYFLDCFNSFGVDHLADCSLNSMCASPLRNTFHDADFNTHSTVMIQKETSLREREVDMEDELYQGQPLEDFLFGAKELERFLLEENNNNKQVDYFNSSSLKQTLSQSSLLPPI